MKHRWTTLLWELWAAQALCAVAALPPGSAFHTCPALALPELALAAAPALAGLKHCCVFSVGSDGTDGPTDAAGGYVDGETEAALRVAGRDVYRTLADNDAYHALQAVGGLIRTGATGTNVNDVAVALVE